MAADRAKSARDEYPLGRLTFRSPHGTETVPTCPHYEAMCDRIDTLTAERDEARTALVHLNDEICECKVLEVTAELRSLRAAVARLAGVTGAHIIGDEPWRAAFKALLALVPSDGSWETEQ